MMRFTVILAMMFMLTGIWGSFITTACLMFETHPWEVLYRDFLWALCFVLLGACVMFTAFFIHILFGKENS